MLTPELQPSSDINISIKAVYQELRDVAVHVYVYKVALCICPHSVYVNFGFLYLS